MNVRIQVFQKLKTANEPAQEEAQAPKLSLRAKFAVFLLYGFVFIDKVFVYVAFGLTAFFAFDRRVFLDRVYTALTRPGPLSGLTWALLLSTIYGIGGLIYGIMTGSQPTMAVEVFAFNICPWFLFVGMHAGTEDPSLARNYIRFLAWFQSLTTPLYYAFLRHSHIGGGEGEFLAPGSGALLLIGIFCFEKDLRRYWFPILVCAFNTIASEIRADWVGLGVSLLVWAVATRQMRRVASMAGVMVALLVVGFIADVRIPALPGRGGEISARDTIGRALSSIDPELAREYSDNSAVYAGTVEWRKSWWRSIRQAVFETPTTTVFGLGYGYPIRNFRADMKKSDIRSPHSIFYFTLAYSGLLGVCMFAIVLANLLNVLWKVYKNTGQIFGFTALIFLIIGSMFGNFFEAPQRSVPCYLLMGMCIGPMILAARRTHPARLSPSLYPAQPDRAWSA